MNPCVQSAPPQLPVPGMSHSVFLPSGVQGHVIAAPPQSGVSYSLGEPVNSYAQSASPQLPVPVFRAV